MISNELIHDFGLFGHAFFLKIRFAGGMRSIFPNKSIVKFKTGGTRHACGDFSK